MDGSVERRWPRRRALLCPRIHEFRKGNFGNLLRRVEDERRTFVVEKRGTPKLLSIQDYVRLASPEPDVLRMIGDDSRRKGTDKLSSRQIDRMIKAARIQKQKMG